MSNTTDQTADRFHSILRAALGPSILQALDDPKVVEVMVNADGSVWTDRISEGRSCIGSIVAKRAESVIRLVADRMGEAVGHHRPLVP